MEKWIVTFTMLSLIAGLCIILVRRKKENEWQKEFKWKKKKISRWQEQEQKVWEAKMKEQKTPILEDNSGSQYNSAMYSQVYMSASGVLYFEAEDGKKFRLIDEEDEVVKTIKEAVKIEKAQIKERQLLI